MRHKETDAISAKGLEGAFVTGEPTEIPTRTPKPVILPILEERHLDMLSEGEALEFGDFAKRGILQKIYEAQLKDVEAKLLAPFGDTVSDEVVVIQIRELHNEHRAVRCSIETLNGLFD